MCLTFRQARGRRELEQVFRLRYRAFAASPYASDLVGGHTSDIDVSPTDVTARHYAVFDDANGEPIAAARAVGWDRGPAADVVEAILSDLGHQEIRPHLPPFPMLDHLERRAIDPAVLGKLQRYGPIVEIGRVCRDPARLDIGTRAFGLLADGALASEFVLHGTEEALGLSVAALVIVYEQLGFTPVQTHSALLRNTSIVGTLVSLQRSQLLVGARKERVESLAGRLDRDQMLVQHFEQRKGSLVRPRRCAAPRRAA